MKDIKIMQDNSLDNKTNIIPNNENETDSNKQDKINNYRYNIYRMSNFTDVPALDMEELKRNFSPLLDYEDTNKVGWNLADLQNESSAPVTHNEQVLNFDTKKMETHSNRFKDNTTPPTLNKLSNLYCNLKSVVYPEGFNVEPCNIGFDFVFRLIILVLCICFICYLIKKNL